MERPRQHYGSRKEHPFEKAVLDEQFKQDCATNTDAVLAVCKEFGVVSVAIGVYHKDIPESKYWGSRGTRSIVTEECDAPGGRWPAIWRIMDKFPTLKAGCGNSNQTQLKSNARLLDGAFFLEDGEWVERCVTPQEEG